MDHRNQAILQFRGDPARPAVVLVRQQNHEEFGETIFSNNFRTGLCFSFVFFAIIIILVTAADTKRKSTIIFSAIFSFLLFAGVVYWRYKQGSSTNNSRVDNEDDINNPDAANQDQIQTPVPNQTQVMISDMSDDGLRLILELHRNLQTIQLLNQRQAQQQLLSAVNTTEVSTNRGLSEDEISKLPKFIYKASEDKKRIKRMFLSDEDEEEHNKINNNNNKIIPDINETLPLSKSSPDSSSPSSSLLIINKIEKRGRDTTPSPTKFGISSTETNFQDNTKKSVNLPEPTLPTKKTITYSENGIDFTFQLPKSDNDNNEKNSLDKSSHYPRQHILPVQDGAEEKPEYCVECSICLGVYVTGEVNIKLHCGHMFHKNCLEEWLRKTNACPLCKQVARKPDVNSSSNGTNNNRRANNALSIRQQSIIHAENMLQWQNISYAQMQLQRQVAATPPQIRQRYASIIAANSQQNRVATATATHPPPPTTTHPPPPTTTTTTTTTIATNSQQNRVATATATHPPPPTTTTTTTTTIATNSQQNRVATATAPHPPPPTTITSANLPLPIRRESTLSTTFIPLLPAPPRTNNNNTTSNRLPLPSTSTSMDSSTSS